MKPVGAYIASHLAKKISDLDPESYFIDFPANPKFGDYTTNVAFVLAKKIGQSPQQVAEDLTSQLTQSDEAKYFSEIKAVNGFINFYLSQNYLFSTLNSIIASADRYGESQAGQSKTVIVEYFQNNVAKPPHVGHLRSAVVGDALYRIFHKLGYKTISDTHIGDWGVQFGILIYAYKTMGKKDLVEADPINELNKLYVQISKQIDEDPKLRDLGKIEFKKLEDGDPDNRQLWQWFVSESVKDFERYRKLLELKPFDYNLGESFYEDKMAAVLDELRSKNLITTGKTGELYVDLEDSHLGRCILVKSDGATTYHLRDFATYLYRKREFDFNHNIYVVDNRQSHHFRQLFKVLELAGYPTEKDSTMVDLGFMSLPEGPISTRKGNAISLQALVDEATKRALKIIEEKNPKLEDKEIVAKQVALGAIKYFDLSHNYKTEFVFEWDKALSFEGNTGPYLQYTHARIHGIIRKSNQSLPKLASLPDLSDQELLLIRKLEQFPSVIESIGQSLSPNILANYLFELASDFNSFYQAVPVLNEKNNQLKDARILLSAATAQVVKNGLDLLGIEAPIDM